MPDYIVTTRDVCVVYRKVLVRNAASVSVAEDRVAFQKGGLVFEERIEETVDGDVEDVREATADEALVIALGAR